MRTRWGLVVAAVLLVAACDPTTVAPTPSSEPPESASPAASADSATALLADPWRPAPLPVDANLVTAIEFACKSPADPSLKAAMENVPVALVDARGDSLVSLILADEHLAFECRVRVENLGGVPSATIIEPPSRLVPDATDPIEADAIRIVSHNRVDEDTGSRTIAFGRVGSDADKVMVVFDDQTEVEASKDHGWFMAWWPGVNSVGAIVAVDRRSVAINGVEEPGKEVQGRVGPVEWWLDPAAAPLALEATSIPAVISERACTSGQPPGDRLLEPVVFESPDAILVNLWARRLEGGGDCQGNAAGPIEIPLSSPVGKRQLLDGSKIPPRDASKPPE
ncbi:MAG TPA: hypothetical protein VFV72_17475 [Candidatus Limnocylindrales bacterium]|nr:hypothetical protein [Candidatus Limnocylindrales bacterium]